LLTRLKQLLTILFFSKKSFSLPKENEIIILDKIGSNKIRDHILGHQDFSIMESKNEKINVPIFLLSIKNIFKYGRFAYEVTFIKFTKAKLLLTWLDNSYLFCNIRELLPNCKLIFFQNGRSDDKRFLHIKEKNIKVDYYFINGSFVKKYFEKNITSNFVVSGSVLANTFEKAKIKKVNKIQWVSHYRPYENLKFFYDKSYIDNFYVLPAEFSLKIINDFCVNNNMELEILGRTGSDEEIDFYKKFIDSSFTMLNNNVDDDYLSTYRKLSNEAIICGFDSQLMYESMALGYRTAFFSIRGHYIKDDSINFSWPKKTPNNGFFWSNKPDEIVLKQILENLLSVKEQNWNDHTKPFKGSMHYDQGNKLIKKTLKEIGLK